MRHTLGSTNSPRRHTLRLITAGIFMCATAALAQTSTAAWNSVVEAAKKEGAVTIYSGQGLDQLNDLAARFKKEYGITVQVVRAVQSELQPKVDTEHETGRGIADLFVTTDVPIVVDRNAKKFMVAPVGPAFDNPAYNRKVRVPEGTYFEVSAAILTFSWNKDLYPKGIKDYSDILDPALKGKIGISNVSTLSQVDFNLYLEEKYGADFLRKLADQQPRLYPGALPMAQAVVSGEIAVGLTTQPLIDEIKKGAPVGWGLSPTGAWGARFYGQILSAAPHPNAAQLLANYLVTQPGQEAVARMAGSVLPNVQGSIASTDNVRVTDWSKLNLNFFNAYVAKWKALFVRQ